MSGCATITDLGVVRDVLTAVDCNTRGFARLGYESLTASGSPFQTALTVALTIYVAVIGYRLLFGAGARMSDGAGHRAQDRRGAGAGDKLEPVPDPGVRPWRNARRWKSRAWSRRRCAAAILWPAIR